MRSAVVEPVGEGVDEGLQFIDAMRQVIGAVELVAPGRLGAFNAAVEVWPLRRQDKEFEAALFVFLLKNGFGLAPAIGPNTANGERRLETPVRV